MVTGTIKFLNSEVKEQGEADTLRAVLRNGHSQYRNDTLAL